MERRDFLKLCAAGAAAAGAPALAADARPQLYSRTLLLDENGAPLRSGRIPVERNLIFHYPFAATPCFAMPSITCLMAYGHEYFASLASSSTTTAPSST